MSRCFPFPPPGYVGSKSGSDALIESIKLQRENEKAKAERKKEKKREKKEKCKRKEKDKGKQYLDQKVHISVPDGEAYDCFGESKGAFKKKTRVEIDEQMERSGLTEEHEKPVSVHKPSYSSDSTENSNKRKLPASPTLSPDDGITGHGNVIRIRLPLGISKKTKFDNKENICSTSGRTELATPLQKNPPIQKQQTLEDKKPTCSPSGADKPFTPVYVPKPFLLNSFEKKLQATSFLYKELVDKLPATVPNESIGLNDDVEWLFSRKQQNSRQVGKNDKKSSDLSCRGSSLLQSRAQFLPDDGVLALPYTLPF